MNDFLSTVKKDLVRKDLLPKYSQAQLFDPENLTSQLNAHFESGLQSMTCKQCHIEIRAPKSWMKEHVKTHSVNKERRDNEIIWHQVNANY